jgi:hypothetical protein
VNLVVNGDFENNSVTPGTEAPVTGLQGWTNTAGSIQVWRVSGYAFESSSSIETDSTTGKDRIEQTFTTVAGRSYRLSFAQTPRPNVSSNSNRLDVFWNGSKIGSVARSGIGLTGPSWQPTTYTVTGTGNDRLSFRENDRDSAGALIDNVQLIAQ